MNVKEKEKTNVRNTDKTTIKTFEPLTLLVYTFNLFCIYFYINFWGGKIDTLYSTILWLGYELI